MRWRRECWIDEIVANPIENLRGESRAELNQQFCARMPVHTVTRGVGMDGEDALTFRQALLKMIGVNRAPPMERRRGVEPRLYIIRSPEEQNRDTRPRCS
jgi:hypothetical protein